MLRVRWVYMRRLAQGLICAAILLFAAATLFECANPTASAESAGAEWLTGGVEVEVFSDYAYQDHDSYEHFYDITCRYTDMEYNTAWITNPVFATAQSCLYDTGEGKVNAEYALPLGSNRRQTIDKYGTFANSSMFHFNPAGTGVAYITNTSPYTREVPELHYIRDWRRLFVYSHLSARGEVIRKPVYEYDFKLTFAGGGQLGVATSPLSFSNNGQWLYARTDAGQLRINTSDFSVVSFAPYRNFHYAAYSAVSKSGRFIVEGNSVDKYYIYDLNYCEPEQPNLASRNCQKRDLEPVIREAYAKTLADPTQLEELHLQGIKFTNDATLDGYFLVRLHGETSGRFIHLKASVSTDVEPVKYLALGDSFSSGEGAGQYWDTTDFYIDENDFNVCHLSKVSYPYIIQDSLEADWTGSVACSGAKAYDINSSVDKYVKNKKSQAFFPIIGSNNQDKDKYIETRTQYYINLLSPGYAPQANYVTKHLPSLATISIGGNDINFKNIVMSCVTQPQCYGRREAREELADLITSKRTDIEKAFRDTLKSMSGKNPRLYAIGYPKILSTADWCGSVFSPHEREFADALVEYLNATIKRAALNAGAAYVDVSDAFIDYSSESDYRLCGDSMIRAVNSINVDTDSSFANEPFDKRIAESYHPNSLGHILLARRIKAYTNNLQVAMPEAPNQPVETIDKSFYIRLVGDDKDLVKEKTVVDPKLVQNPALYKDEFDTTIQYKIDPVTDLPAASTTARVELHSDPVVLGYLPILADGTISGKVSIPDTVEPGFHEIHLYYTDVLGEIVNIYQHVFIGATKNDYDGDGVLNDKEACLIGEPSGFDNDKDGIDDMCDPEIVKASAGNNTSAGTNNIVTQALNRQVITADEATSVQALLEPGVVTEPPRPQTQGTTANTSQSVLDASTEESQTISDKTTSQKTSISLFAAIALSLVALLIIGWKLAISFLRKNR